MVVAAVSVFLPWCCWLQQIIEVTQSICPSVSRHINATCYHSTIQPGHRHHHHPWQQSTIEKRKLRERLQCLIDSVDVDDDSKTIPVLRCHYGFFSSFENVLRTCINH